jgi:hypothetical protein
LRLTWATETQPTALSFKVRPTPNQTGSEVVELSQLHLKFALTGACSQRKYIEYQPCSIDHPTVERLFQIALLYRGCVMIEYDNIHRQLINQFGDLKNLPRTQEGGWVGYLSNRADVSNNL